MNEETPRDVGDVPPDRQAEENPPGADPDTGGTNPERQGPGGDDATSPRGPADPPSPSTEQGPSGPPHESVPGDEGQVPNPKQ